MARAAAPHSLLSWLQSLTQLKNLHPTPLLQEVPRGTKNQSLGTALLLSSKCSQKMSNAAFLLLPPSLPIKEKRKIKLLAAVGPIPAPGTPELAQQHIHTCCSLVSWQPAFDAILEKRL